MRLNVLACVALLALLCSAAVGSVYAGSTFSWDYTKVNTATKDFRALDEATTSISFHITNLLTYNATTSSAKAVLSFINGSTGTVWGFDLVFVKDGTFEVALNMPSYVKICESKWTANQTTYVSVNDDGDLEVSNETYTYLEEYSFGTFTFRYVAVCGLAFACTYGYISMSEGLYGGGSGDMTASLMEWMPTVVSFAMLGMVMGLLKKLGKW